MPPRWHSAGFSLLELLVALFVIVLVTSVATLNVGSGSADTRLESQLRRLQGSAAFLTDEAQLVGRDYGMLLHPVAVDGRRHIRVEWREHRPVGWRLPEAERDIHAALELASDVDVVLELEQALGAELLPLDDPQTAVPQVIYYASGEVTPGAIEVRETTTGDVLWRLQWDLLGRSELLPRGVSVGDPL